MAAEKRSDVKKANPAASFKDLSQLVAAAWKALTPTAKQVGRAPGVCVLKRKGCCSG